MKYEDHLLARLRDTLKYSPTSLLMSRAFLAPNCFKKDVITDTRSFTASLDESDNGHASGVTTSKYFFLDSVDLRNVSKLSCNKCHTPSFLVDSKKSVVN